MKIEFWPPVKKSLHKFEKKFVDVKIDYEKHPGAHFYSHSHGRTMNGTPLYKIDYSGAPWLRRTSSKKQGKFYNPGEN
jgi:hypothetical protein